MHRSMLYIMVAVALSFAYDRAWSSEPSPAPASQETDKVPLRHYYGFRSPEMFKLSERARNLLTGDLNGDGLEDLAVVDNSHSRIDVLLSRREKQPTPAAQQADQVNEITNGGRFEHRKVAVNNNVFSLALGDFNADGRTDLAYFANPDQVVVRLQDSQGGWPNRRRIDVDEVPSSPGILDAGDLNGDGLDDLALLGSAHIYLFYQAADHRLADPKRLPNTSQDLRKLHIADLNGDGLNDLVYEASEDDEQPLCVRLQGADHRLGPEIRLEMPTPQAFTLAELDGKPAVEVVTIEERTKRTKVYGFQHGPAKDTEGVERVDASDSAAVGHTILYGLGRQSRSRSGDVALGDLDGDGRLDVVASDPGGAQMIVLRQSSSGGLEQGETFPGLVGVEVVRAGDLDGDGRAEVVVASTSEKTIGVSRFEDGRLTFPRSLSIVDVPEALDLVDLDGDAQLEIVYVSRQRKGSRTERALRLLVQDGEGGWKPRKFGSLESVSIDLRTDADALLAFDANRDSRIDYLVFAGSTQPPVFLTTGENGQPQVADAEGGLGLAGTTAEGAFLGQLDGPVLLMAQKNFARNVAVDEQGRWQVTDQYNAPSGAKIVGVAALDVDGDGQREIALVDQGNRKIHLLKFSDGLYRPWQRLNLGTFDFRAVHVAELDGNDSEDLLLVGASKIAVLYTRKRAPRLRELVSFETTLRDTRFTNLVAGELNDDGRMDVALFDTSRQYVQILAVGPGGTLLPSLHFKVFESKNFRGDREGGLEPREAVVADVTGDGRNDLILLVHDRVLVLPQDDGTEMPQQATAAKD